MVAHPPTCKHCGRIFDQEVTLHGWRVDVFARRVFGPAGESVRLRPREVELLFILMRARGGIVHRERIVAMIWGADPPNYPMRTIDLYACCLRSRLASHGFRIKHHVGLGLSVNIENPNSLHSSAA